jgi:hypothetical protein
LSGERAATFPSPELPPNGIKDAASVRYATWVSEERNRWIWQGWTFADLVLAQSYHLLNFGIE